MIYQTIVKEHFRCVTKRNAPYLTSFEQDEIWKVSLLYKSILTCIHSKFFITYSHSQWLFYKFVSKITKELVKQSLRVTVCIYSTAMSLFQIVEIYYHTFLAKISWKRDQKSHTVLCCAVSVGHNTLNEILCQIYFNFIVMLSQYISVSHCGNCGNLHSRTFKQKFNESNVFTKEVTKELKSLFHEKKLRWYEIEFSTLCVRKINFHIFWTKILWKGCFFTKEFISKKKKGKKERKNSVREYLDLSFF